MVLANILRVDMPMWFLYLLGPLCMVNMPVVWGDGTQTRDFIFVEEAASLFQKSLELDCVILSRKLI